MKKQKITFLDKLTGEVIGIEYSTIEEAEQLYITISSMYKALERAKGKLNEYMGAQVQDEHEFDDGRKGKWISGKTRKYRMEVVRKYLDEDQMALVTEVNSKKLKDLLEQLVGDGKGLKGAWADIEENADITMKKSYFTITKG